MTRLKVTLLALAVLLLLMFWIGAPVKPEPEIAREYKAFRIMGH